LKKFTFNPVGRKISQLEGINKALETTFLLEALRVGKASASVTLALEV